LKEEILSKILSQYKVKRDFAQKEAEERLRDLRKTYPKLLELDDKIYYLNLKISKLAIIGDDGSLDTLKADLESLKKEKERFLAEENISRDILKPRYSCSLCEDTGYVERENRWVKCNCLISRLIEETYKKSNIMDQIERDNFSNFNLSLFDSDILEGHDISSKENIQFILKRTTEFIDSFKDKDVKNLLFYGNPGLGKTYMCTSAAKALMDKGHTVLYHSSSELFQVLSDYTFSRDERTKSSSKEIYGLIMGADLLIIDDLGSELTNSFVINQLFNIINIRSMGNKKLIISTNLSPSEIKETYGDRIFSRLVMLFDFFEFYGSDIRWKL